MLALCKELLLKPLKHMVDVNYRWVGNAYKPLLVSLRFVNFNVVAGDKAQRRGSVGSLDSGMSVSFQSTSASTCSRSDKMAGKQAKPGVHHHQGFLGSLFNKRHTGGTNITPKSTEV